MVSAHGFALILISESVLRHFSKSEQSQHHMQHSVANPLQPGNGVINAVRNADVSVHAGP